MMWSDILRMVEQHRRFVITTHTNPDLDGLGSELALEEYLRRLGRQVVILNSDSVSPVHRFIDRAHRVRAFDHIGDTEIVQRSEVIFVLDVSGGWDRTGQIGKVLAGAKGTTIRIDHHSGATGFADLEVVDTDAAATGELIFDLISSTGGDITPTMAEALYLAILTDTGSFRYPKTNPSTHRIAARLLELGVDPTRLYKQVYEQYSLDLIRLKGRVLDSLQLGAGGRLVWCALDQATLNHYGVQAADLNGFPGMGMAIRGVQVSVFCVEAADGKVKVSLRSDGTVAVNELAARWRGGGHASAAGATIKGDLASVTEEVVAQAESAILGRQAGASSTASAPRCSG